MPTLGAGTDTDLMTTREVAAYLRRSYGRTVELMGGSIPATKVGRQWLARRCDVDAFLTAGRTTRKAPRRRGRGRRAATP